MTTSSVDAFGDASTVTTTDYAIQGIRDNFSAEFATINAIPITDVRILLIVGLIKPATMPLQDDLINFYGEWYQVRRVLEIDPARASIVLQAFRREAP